MRPRKRVEISYGRTLSTKPRAVTPTLRAPPACGSVGSVITCARSAASERARAYHYPRWSGQDLSGKTLLVWGERGYGDEIQFARFNLEWLFAPPHTPLH